MKQVRVLFIAGYGRSGSTVLGEILGAVEGVFHGGELNFIWEHNLLGNRSCGCGRPFDECPVWTEVLARAFGEHAMPDAAAMADVLRSGTRTRHAVLMLSGPGRERISARLRPVLDHIYELYSSAVDVTGATLLVDSSKLPTYGFALSMHPGFDVRTVHLVRDPRGTAWSWSRPKEAPDQGGRYSLPKVGIARSAALWDAWNVMTECFWRGQDGRHLLVRYEDLVSDPRSVIGEVLTFAGHSGEAPFVSDREVELVTGHTVAGNPNRFQTGRVAVRSDNPWKDTMPRKQQAIVTALTLPVMHHYGYRVFP